MAKLTTAKPPVKPVATAVSATAATATRAARKAAGAPSALPLLIVPKGKRRPLATATEASSAIVRSLTASEVLKIAKEARPALKVALPWATLSARRAYVKDKASAKFNQVAWVSGAYDTVSLGLWADKKHSRIEVTLASTSPGELFVVVVKGRSNGPAVLRFDGDNGTAEASMEAGDFRCPFALSPTDTESRFELSLVDVPSEFEPTSFTVRAIDIWHVN
jgi:hypothetical protein